MLFRVKSDQKKTNKDYKKKKKYLSSRKYPNIIRILSMIQKTSHVFVTVISYSTNQHKILVFE